MNYNFIYDEQTGEHIDIFTDKGSALLTYYASFLKNKKNKNKKYTKQIKTLIDKSFADTYICDIVFTKIGKCKYKMILSDIENLLSHKQYLFLFLLHIFTNDTLYRTINFYTFISILYSCVLDYKDTYKEINIHTHNNNESTDKDTIDSDSTERTSVTPITYDKDRVHQVLHHYHNKYSLSKKTIRLLIIPTHTTLYDSLKTLLNVDTYKYCLDNCIRKHFITKLYIHS